MSKYIFQLGFKKIRLNFEYDNQLVTLSAEPYKTIIQLKAKAMKMFFPCPKELKTYYLNQDISRWIVSRVTDMSYMFFRCVSFNQDISNWDVSKVADMCSMFTYCKSFNQDISKWNVSNVRQNYHIFDNCPIKEEYKPKFK